MKLLSLLLALMLALPTMAIEKDGNARKILDATAKKFNKAKAVEASFNISSFVGSTQQGSGSGKMTVKGKKFMIDTNGHKSWYNEKTLWSYSEDINEVTLSTPTKKELQSMNPYAFISLYKQGYGYTVKDETYGGKAVYEIRLLAENAEAGLPEILLTVAKDYTPLCIRMRQGKSNWTRINITKCSFQSSVGDDVFVFPSSQYPDVTEVDLRD